VKTSVAYDSNGNVQSASSGDGTGALTATTAMTYDPAGNLVAVDGPLPGTADTSRIRYDSARRVVGTISPDPDGPGQPLQHRAVRNVFDPTTGLLLRTEQGHVADLSDTAWNGFVAKQAVEIEHDSNARPVETRLTANGAIYALAQTSYDPLGRPDCTAQRMNKAIFATIATPACELGTRGSGAEDHGPDRITRTRYDRSGRVAQVRTALGVPGVEAAEATYAYRPNGQVHLLVDGRGNRTEFTYDGHDRLERTHFPSPAVPGGFDDSTPASALFTAGAASASRFEQRARDPDGKAAIPLQPGDQPPERVLKIRRQGQGGRQELRRVGIEPGALAPLPGDHVEHVHPGFGDSGQIVRPKLALAGFVEALLGDVGSDPLGELRLLKPEPLPFLLEPCPECHRPCDPLNRADSRTEVRAKSKVRISDGFARGRRSVEDPPVRPAAPIRRPPRSSFQVGRAAGGRSGRGGKAPWSPRRSLFLKQDVQIDPPAGAS
jgi:YD repeat-containing protein